MSIKIRRLIGSVLFVLCMCMTCLLMMGIIMPNMTATGADLLMMLALIVMFGIGGVWLILSTIESNRIKCTIMKYFVMALAIIYILALLYVMILSRVTGGAFGRIYASEYGRDINLVPLKSIGGMISMVINKELNSGIMIENISGNILMFIPMVIFGKIIFTNIKKKYMYIIVPMIICLVLEIIQCLTYAGAFDIDDILLNSIGILVGYLITKIDFFNIILKRLYLLENDKECVSHN